MATEPPHTTPALTTAEQRVAKLALEPFIIASLGQFSFGYVWERYKKVLTAAHSNLDPSLAFGLSPYNLQANFVLQFPSAVVTSWDPDLLGPAALGPYPNRPIKPTWFADVLRNAFAHGQVTILPNRKVRLTNKRNAAAVGTFNLDINLSQQDLEKLIAQGLQNFVTNVIVGGTYEPLSKLLALCL